MTSALKRGGRVNKALQSLSKNMKLLGLVKVSHKPNVISTDGLPIYDGLFGDSKNLSSLTFVVLSGVILSDMLCAKSLCMKSS